MNLHQPIALRALGALALLRIRYVVVVLGIVTVLGCAVALWYVATPPSAFPVGMMVEVKEGQPLSVVAESLHQEYVIRSPFLFTASLRLLGKDNDIDSGIYIFDTPASLITVGVRLVNGEFGFAPERITLTEGMTVRDMSAVLKRAIPDFDTEQFIEKGTVYEGYLFPDTYFFMPDVTPDVVIERMRTTFDERIEPLRGEIEESRFTLEEIVTFASILEKEGRSFEVRQKIAGVLMNRLEDEMPLQVDAVFGYIYGRPTYSPTLSDLESDSPYNTYRVVGLPPGPINNPGLDAIQAVLEPIASNNYYYLTDNEGVMHYAKTFEEHKANRARYGI
ncbi:endolytic transglycosylase MltG [Patescibacteria group bacterium]|nr:endolytic transglycosylase MltG [Patescibacteria group bacterium]